MAAVQACGRGAALSHPSAADLWGIRRCDTSIAVTVSRVKGRARVVDGEQGIHEVDAVWPACRLGVQLDGFAYHRTRRDRARDAASDADLELAGYRVVRLIWDDVAVHGARTARRLRLLLSDT